MTPDKGLDQIEPLLADVAQKTDRLIESNGQILEVATLADIISENQTELRDKTALLIEGQTSLHRKTDLLATGQVALQSITADLHNKTDLLTKGQANLHRKTDLITGDQVKLRQEMQQGFQEVNQKFAQVEKTQQQILTLLLDRLS